MVATGTSYQDLDETFAISSYRIRLNRGTYGRSPTIF
jgi:hypothetical protein